MEAVSAFGVVHTLAKAQVGASSEGTPYKDQFRATSSLAPHERSALRAKLAAPRPKRVKANPAYRNLSTVYGNHAFTHAATTERERFIDFGDKVSGRLHDMIKSPTTPSAVHRNVHYAASVPEGARSFWDKTIDPKVASKLRRPTVIHHSENMGTGFGGAALPAHVTTGRKAHVVISVVNGKPHSMSMPGGAKGTINHELAHTIQGKKTNPAMWATKGALANSGNEAKADALSGANVYTKGGVVPNEEGAASVDGRIQDRRQARPGQGCRGEDQVDPGTAQRLPPGARQDPHRDG